MDYMIETIVRMTVDGTPMPPFLCTPEHLDELAIGSLIVQGMISGTEDIASLSVEGSRIAVATKNGIRPPLSLDERVATLAPVSHSDQTELSDAAALVDTIVHADSSFGTHCVLLRAADAVLLREDIGRHNAMDKAIGAGATRGVDFSRAAIAATGRISLEMLIKAASVGIPLIVSKKYPSNLSLEVAEKLGIRIIGKAVSQSPIDYRH